MVTGQNVFDKQVKNDLRTYDNIQKIATRADDYATSCLLYYDYFRKLYSIIGVKLITQQELDADLKKKKKNTANTIQFYWKSSSRRKFR